MHSTSTNQNAINMRLLIKSPSFDKNYLLQSTTYKYNSAMDLIFELFSKYHFIDREAELFLLQLLKDTAYSTIEEIPISQLNAIVNYFLAHRDQYKVNYDEERLTYLLLAAIQSKYILLSIDEKIITDLLSPIQLRADSTISFFRLDKLRSINFKSI